MFIDQWCVRRADRPIFVGRNRSPSSAIVAGIGRRRERLVSTAHLGQQPAPTLTDLYDSAREEAAGRMDDLLRQLRNPATDESVD